MSAFLECLRARRREFEVETPAGQRIADYLLSELLSAPRAAASLSHFVFRSAQTPGRPGRAFISTLYEAESLSCPVILVRTARELVIAVSIALRLHLPRVKLVVDNRGGLIAEGNRFSILHACEEYVGEELQIHQQSRTRTFAQSMFRSRLLVFTVETSYFDSAKEINDLSCILAEQAGEIRRRCHGDTRAILDEVLRYLRGKVVYRKSGRTADHSAVGLIRNGTAVCQGIAACAFQLLYFCGVDARYVKGMGFGSGSWGPHGWNMVRLGDKWRHIDYTFELRSGKSSVLVPETQFRSEHRWDEALYHPSLSTEVTATKRKLDHSVFEARPNGTSFTVNGCAVDMTGRHRLLITEGGAVYAAVLDLVSLCGGCYQLKRDCLWLYVGTDSYGVPLRDFIYRGGAWYYPAARLPGLGFRVRAGSSTVSIRRAV